MSCKRCWPACILALLAVAGCNNAKPQSLNSDNQDSATQGESASSADPNNTNAQQSVPLSAAAQQLLSGTQGSEESLPLEGQSNSVDLRDAPQASQDSTSGTPGMENAATPSPQVSSADQAVVPAMNASQILNRSFMTLRPTDSDDPIEILEHLEKTDSAISDLVLAGANNVVETELFMQAGRRLGDIKLKAGQRLANSPAATDEQRRKGVLAQLISLSHLTGLGDVEAAQQLEELASVLVESEDKELAHESLVVLVGFEIQSLQNGVTKSADELLLKLNRFFEYEDQRSPTEFASLQNAYFVLTQMGFDEAKESVANLVVENYLVSDDPEVRGEAWILVARDSQAVANYNQAMQSLGNDSFAPQELVSAARGLYVAFPYAATLEQLSSSVATIEYGGKVEASRQLAAFVREQLEATEGSTEILVSSKTLISEHESRLGLIGQPLQLGPVTAFDGQPFDLEQYRGKVVLVDFWATWCVPCLQELPNIRSVYDDLNREGFEVVSVNMDDLPETAKTFIERQAFPWRSLHFSDAPGFQSQFAKQTGLRMIPFIVLIGTDGNVAQVHVRGDDLYPTVRRLLGLEDSLIP